MIVTKIPVGELSENCYIISTEKGNAVAVDSGAEPEKLLSFLKENSLTLKKILLTHGHFDHYGAVAELVKNTGAEVFIHSLDVPMLSSDSLSLGDNMGVHCEPVTEYTTVKDGDVICLDELEFHVLYTPGHTKGGVTYVCNDAVFSGDTLFCGDVGRTDFPGGSYPEIIASVRKIAALDGDYKVYPGHGHSSVLSTERATNQYIKGNNNDFDF